MLPWLWTCWRVPSHAAAPAARTVHRAWAARPRIRHHVVGPIARRLPRAAAAAGKGVIGAAGVAGTTLVCARLPSAILPPPAYAAPVASHEASYGGGYGWPGLPGWLGTGGGVWWPTWLGGPAPGDTTDVPPLVGATTGAPPCVYPPDVPPGMGPGFVPPGVTVVASFVPHEAPRDVPEPAALAVLAAGLAALAAARR